MPASPAGAGEANRPRARSPAALHYGIAGFGRRQQWRPFFACGRTWYGALPRAEAASQYRQGNRLIRHLILAASLALGLAPAHTLAAGATPPPAYAEHVAALRKADAIRDPLQRCLAYPDLPGNTWAPGVAKARCIMFLTPPVYTLDSLEKALAQPGGATTVDAPSTRVITAG